MDLSEREPFIVKLSRQCDECAVVLSEAETECPLCGNTRLTEVEIDELGRRNFIHEGDEDD